MKQQRSSAVICLVAFLFAVTIAAAQGTPQTQMPTQPNERIETGYAQCVMGQKEVQVLLSPQKPWAIATLKCGEEVSLLGREESWVRIRTKEGKEAYVSEGLLSQRKSSTQPIAPGEKRETTPFIQSQPESKPDAHLNLLVGLSKPPKMPKAGKPEAQQPDEPVLNGPVKSPKHEYPLHVRVLRSDVQFVMDNTTTAFTNCWTLFGSPVCSTTASGPSVQGVASMHVLIEESGEEVDIWCGHGSNLYYYYCAALPVGRYAARWWNGQRRALVIPALPLEGKKKDKEVAAYFKKDVHHPTRMVPQFDPARK